MSFRVEYKRGTGGPVMFQRQVRFQVDITPVCPPNDTNPLFAINFILLSGIILEFIFNIASQLRVNKFK